jgi:hypothetical protein
MADKIQITDLDVKKVNVQMPVELKQMIDMLHTIKISEDTIQITLFNQGTGVVVIWIYNSSKEGWTKLVLS